MELKRFWVRGYKSLRDVAIEFPTKLTIVTGPSGSGKTALTEAFEALQQNGNLGNAIAGIEAWGRECNILYELGGGKKALMSNCNPGEAEDAVRRFLSSAVVIRDIDWKAVRSLRPVGKEAKLLPDASNFVPLLYGMTGGTVPDSLVEALRYVMPSIHDLRFATDGGVLLLRLTTEDGAVMTQATMPGSVLKTPLIEVALVTRPSMVATDDFECGADQETQQFLVDEPRSRDVCALVTTHSETALDYATPKEVVLPCLINGETKARRLTENCRKSTSWPRASS